MCFDLTSNGRIIWFAFPLLEKMQDLISLDIKQKMNANQSENVTK